MLELNWSVFVSVYGAGEGVDGGNLPLPTRPQRPPRRLFVVAGKPYVPSSPAKKSTGLGTHYGTLGGNITSFSPGLKPEKEEKSPGANFTTNPGKKGTGFGFIDVTIGKD